MGLSKSKCAANAGALSSKSVRKAVRNKQLAPILEGQDDPSSTLDECPICLLHYPAVNTAACCGNSLCTECYLQVALSRSEHGAQLCPFCNKANYSVTFHAKTSAQRAAERSERALVEQAVLHARQEEERRSEHRRRKHSAGSSAMPMSPEQGSLAEEWARAQEEEQRYMDTRQERWRESLARAAAAADAGDEADDTDVEELMIMQALLLSLDEQHGGSHGSGDAGGPSDESGPSGAAETGSTASGGSAASRLAEALRARSHAAACQEDAASDAVGSTDAAGGMHASGAGPDVADVPDAELLAHAARLAERTAAQPDLWGSADTQCEAARSGPGAVAATASQAGEQAAPAEWSPTIAYVQAAAPTAAVGSPAPAPSAAIPCLRRKAGSGQAQAAPAIGSAALATALAEANGWSAPPQAAHLEADDHAGNAPRGMDEELTAAPAADVGSAALAEALAAANGWLSADTHGSSSEQTAQAAIRQPASPFVGMVTVHTAAHVLPPHSSPSTPPSPLAAADHAPLEPPSPAAPAQAAPAGGGGHCSEDDADSDGRPVGVAALLGEEGGAALLLQPDGSSALVLLTGSVAKPAAAAAVVAPAAPAPADSEFTGIPMYEIDGQDAADRQLAAALAAADTALMQHTQAALQQQTLALQQADEQYRIALDAYAARDEAMQRAIRESDERLRALYSSS